MANTYTTNLNLAKPAKGDVDWDDEINGNSDIIDTALGSEHNADGTHKNTIKIGDNANTTDKKIVAHTGETNEPYLSYDVSHNEFEIANDGLNPFPIITQGEKTIEVAHSGKQYSSIHLAMAAAAAGDVILIYPGTYVLTTELVVDRAVYIKAMGDVTITADPPSGSYTVSVIAGATLDGLHIVMTAVTGNGPLKIASSGVTIKNCFIDNNGASGNGLKCDSGTSTIENCVTETSNGFGVDIVNGTHTFKGTKITGATLGVNVQDNASLTITFDRCEINAGGNNEGIKLIDSVSNHTLICKYTTIRKSGSATYTVVETASGSSGKIYQCSLNAAINITNDITTPYNVVDTDV